MKRITFYLSIVFILLFHNAGASDFSAVAPSGQRLYYKIVNGNAVVTYKQRMAVSNTGYYQYNYYYNGTKPAGNLIIPDSVTYQNTTYIVNGIDEHAFEGCTGLISVSMGNNIKSIGDHAFYMDTSLTTIILSDSLVSIGSSFYGCWSLTSISLPESLTSIGNGAFCECRSLTSISLPESLTSIGDGAFYQCRSLTSISIPGSVTSIGQSAFRESGIVSMVIPNSVLTIGDYLFQNCPSLTTVVIGSSISYFNDNNVFLGCNRLTIIMRGYPPSLGNSTCNIPANSTIYVPCGTFSSYQNAQKWSNYTIVDACATITTAVNDPTRGGVSGGGNYMIGDSVTLTAIPFTGSSFIGWSTGSQVNPLKFVATQSQTITAAFGSGSLPHDTIYIHDTTYLNNYIHDTTIQYVDRYIHDTTFYAVYIHDTTTIHDTTYQTIHDTVIAYINVPVHDTTYLNIHDTLIAYIPIHDTVYIHDTVFINQEGIDEVEGLNVKIYQRNGRLVVDGAGQNTVSLFDAVGRTLAVKREDNERIVFDVPNTGVYLVKIGVLPARRILVIK